LEWAQAWSSKDFETYAEFYSDSFETRKFGSKEEWLEYRKPRILGKRSIQVDIQNLVIKALDAGLAEVRFEQNYRAGNLKVRSVKKMQLAREGDTWKILWEGN
jgi:murein L,D-transpeptidase YafK